ncbi:TonB-dependent receptor [Sphingomonas oligophenolica]|uniref:TonB-dependent receptor n=1 Tax=Sphingomonas oligophenolica TaxID=301154 RepID=A0ABU9Y0T3_9SPHN
MSAPLYTATSVIALLAGAALAPAAAAAQTSSPAQTEAAKPADDLAPEITVTAQRRSEASRDVPISVTTLGAEQLAVANVTNLSDSAKLTPGLRFDTQGPASQPTIRGVGTAITTSGGGPNVGIYVDGFFQQNAYVNDFQLTKVQSIQVLKGPQGTLFGRNTTGGAILVTTADPSMTPEAEFKAQYGSFNTVVLQGYGTTGLGDRVAIDLEGNYRRGDGYVTNIVNGDKKIGQSESWSIRAGLKIEVTDDVSVLLRYTHSQSSDPSPQLVNAYVDTTGEAGFFNMVSAAGKAIYGRTSSAGLPLVYLYAPAGTFATGPGRVASNELTSFKSRSDIVQGTIHADLGFANLTSYTQYRYDNSPYFGDLDVTTLPFFAINVRPVDRTFSQELLFNSKTGSRLQWTAGLNYFQVRDTWGVSGSFSQPAFYLPFGGSSALTKSAAAYADLTYEVTPKFFITAGARYSHDVVTDAYFKTNFAITSYEGADGNPVPVTVPPETKIPVNDLKNNAVTPRVVLRYKPSAESSVYASYTRGYKSGLLNVGGLSKVPVKPENINAFELGYKYDDRVFAIDLAGFYYDYRNLQVSSFQNGAAQIRNAASSEIYGAEAQLRYRVSSAFNLNAGAAYTHARYKSFRNAPYYSYCDPAPAATGSIACSSPAAAGTLTQTVIDASGFQMQRAPEFTANAGASYALDAFSGRLTLSGNLYYSSSFYFDPSQQFRQKAYEQLSLRAQWSDPSKRYTLALFGDNVTGTRYRTQVLFNTLGIGSTWNAPTIWGVSLGAKF